MDEKSTEKGEGKKYRKVKRKIRLCCYFVWPLSFNLSGLGDPNRSIKTPANIAIRVTEVRNPPTTERWQHGGRTNRKAKRKIRLCWYLVWPLSFNLSGLGGPNRSIQKIASIALLVIEVCNPQPPRKGDSTPWGIANIVFGVLCLARSVIINKISITSLNIKYLYI